jgi:hypothetical protein
MIAAARDRLEEGGARDDGADGGDVNAVRDDVERAGVGPVEVQAAP